MDTPPVSVIKCLWLLVQVAPLWFIPLLTHRCLWGQGFSCNTCSKAQPWGAGHGASHSLSPSELRKRGVHLRMLHVPVEASAGRGLPSLLTCRPGSP